MFGLFSAIRFVENKLYAGRVVRIAVRSPYCFLRQAVHHIDVIVCFHLCIARVNNNNNNNNIIIIIIIKEKAHSSWELRGAANQKHGQVRIEKSTFERGQRP